MENTYDYLFWHNYLENTWYAIPRDKYLQFFNGGPKPSGVLKSEKVDTLVKIINNPELLKK